ncbi:antitoxin [Methylomonas rosea]|uniref:Antitoxin n=1 Tax=Methylomonas rosea TaxID=2952227 RepID=A0ABT1TNM2_9GAMM|nr:antitoxin [Methylomonas sp. WSC-7]MCQ8116381.1 antitoxin [Methylomonas sp. WSC-7]
MATELSVEEQEVVDYVEGGAAVSVDNLDGEKSRYSQIARDQIGKKKTVSIRLLESDLERLKAQSVRQGLPYQVLISSLIHQYANGKIKFDV